MIEEEYTKKIVSLIIIISLGAFIFFMMKPILTSVIFGFILAFILMPVYGFANKFLKSPNISAFLICFFLILMIILPVWYFSPLIINQSVKVYISVQQIDFVSILKKIFPSLFSSDAFSREIGSSLYSFTTKMAGTFANAMVKIISNFVEWSLKLMIVFFTMFFVLRDKDSLVSYIKSILPFSKEVEKRLFDSSREITSSVIYGQILVGIIQGVIVGIGFIVFKIPNALILTLLASIAGVLPIVGTFIVWVPVIIYLLVAGNSSTAIGILAFGLISSSIDNILRPIFISRKTNLHPMLILVGMIGGYFLFGVLGFVIGPLIIAYSLIIFDIYRLKSASGLFDV